MKRQTSNIDRIKKSVQARKTPQQARAKDTVEKILKGARTLLQREGRKGLTAKQLAKESGLSTGAIYDHFPGISAVLYQLYEERLNQELRIYQKVYGRDTGEISIEELIDNHIQEDAAMQWGSKADIELDEAAFNDPQLKTLVEHNQTLKRDQLVEALKRRHSNATGEQLKALASYMIELTEVAFRLRHKSDLSEKDLIRSVTIDLLKRTAQFSDNL